MLFMVGGLGMRALHDVRNAAFVGAWFQCIAHLRRAYGHHMPGLEAGWGEEEMSVYPFQTEFKGALAALDLLSGGSRDSGLGSSGGRV